MRAAEFITEATSSYRPVRDPNELAQQYLNQMFSKGVGHRAAVSSVIDLLNHRGIEYSLAADIVKRAFSKINGSDVTTEE